MRKVFPNAWKYGVGFFSIMLLINLILTPGLLNKSIDNSNSGNYSQSSFSEKSIKIYKEKPEFQEIQIPEQGFSKLIEIPPGRCSWINSPGWLEYWFATRKGYEKSFSVIDGEQKWDKKISPSSRFKLKGQPGIAKIWLEPCPRNSD